MQVRKYFWGLISEENFESIIQFVRQIPIVILIVNNFPHSLLIDYLLFVRQPWFVSKPDSSCLYLIEFIIGDIWYKTSTTNPIFQTALRMQWYIQKLIDSI